VSAGFHIRYTFVTACKVTRLIFFLKEKLQELQMWQVIDSYTDAVMQFVSVGK